MNIEYFSYVQIYFVSKSLYFLGLWLVIVSVQIPKARHIINDNFAIY